MSSASLLPDCPCRHDWDVTSGTFFCAHPKVHSTGNLVTAANCKVCKRWQEPPQGKMRPYPTLAGIRRDGPCVFLGRQTGARQCKSCRGNVQIKIFECAHPEHNETTYRDCRMCADYDLQLKAGTIESWAVGVTTAPRSEETLPRTLASLARAGWNDVRIFAEPESTIPKRASGISLTQRETKLGPWPNWYLALTELYLREPNADAYLLAQDDVLMCRGIREYLESVLWPAERIGFVSFYRSSYYGRGTHGFSEIDLAGGLMGALTLVFPNFAVRSLLSHRQTLAHRLRGRDQGMRNIDDVIAAWARQSKLPGFVHSPSLAQHIGDESSIWTEGENRAKRRADDFVGENSDARSLPGQQVES